MDGNGKNPLLVWTIVESERSWFLSLLKQDILQALNMNLISERDKVLMAADAMLGNGVNRPVCCFHLKGELCRGYS